jgi:spore coat protein CotH
VQVNKGRVDIDEDTGYLVEITSRYDEEPKFRSNEILLPVVIKSPEDTLSSIGDNFVKQSVNKLVEKMFSGSFPENGYRDLIDIDTFVDYIMIQEFLANSDFWSPGSVYMYRDGGEGSKICMGPLWDFDNTLGNPNIRIPPSSDKTKRVGEVFWERFFEDPVFSARYKERWDAHYSMISADMPSFIDRMANQLSKSQKTDYKLWQGTLVDDVYYSNIINDLKSWWAARVTFMNGEIQ